MNTTLTESVDITPGQLMPPPPPQAADVLGLGLPWWFEILLVVALLNIIAR